MDIDPAYSSRLNKNKGEGGDGKEIEVTKEYTTPKKQVISDRYFARFLMARFITSSGGSEMVSKFNFLAGEGTPSKKRKISISLEGESFKRGFPPLFKCV
jgi:hypothetical protein